MFSIIYILKSLFLRTMIISIDINRKYILIFENDKKAFKTNSGQMRNFFIVFLQNFLI